MEVNLLTEVTEMSTKTTQLGAVIKNSAKNCVQHITKNTQREKNKKILLWMNRLYLKYKAEGVINGP